LRLRLAAPGPALRAPRQSRDVEAYHLYLRGRYHWNKRLDAELREGLRCFEQAIEKDPGYALAYAGLADSYALMGYLYGLMPPHQAMPRAKAAARRALEIDPELADAHACLGFVKAHYDWDWAGAEADFQRSLALDPGRATTHQWYSHYLLSVRRFDAAMDEARRAWELDPLSPIVNAFLILAPTWSGRGADQALAELRRQVEMEPVLAVGRVFLGMGYLAVRKDRDALAVLEPFSAAGGASLLAQVSIASALARSGDHAGARRVLGEMHAAARERYVPPSHFAHVLIALGDSDEAFFWLDRALAERDGWLAYLDVYPLFDDLRGDPRFDALLRRIGLAAPAGADGT
ncbi:MAG: hypothetical protein JOZ15_14385, partial [Acidobacteria bacterium]|nr:hypothetical protein [Acidobacteriota bacterium]